MEIWNYWDGQMDFIWAIHLISFAVFIILDIAKGTEYFYSFNTFGSKQELQLALKYWSNLSVVLFGKGQEIHEKS